MSKKTIFKEDPANPALAKVMDKSEEENLVPDKAAPKAEKPTKKTTFSQVDAIVRSAVDAVKPHSSRDVRGSEDL